MAEPVIVYEPSELQRKVIAQRPLVFGAIKIHLFDEVPMHVVVGTCAEATYAAIADHHKYRRTADAQG